MQGELAAHVFTVLAVLGAVFQAALAVGMPWGQLTWGGKFVGQLPGYMRGMAVVSMALLIAFAVIVAVRAGVLWPSWQPRSRALIWGVVAYCGLGVVANALTASRWERLLWLPVVSAMLACSVIVAVS
jgi:hypothetical protein